MSIEPGLSCLDQLDSTVLITLAKWMSLNWRSLLRRAHPSFFVPRPGFCSDRAPVFPELVTTDLTRGALTQTWRICSCLSVSLSPPLTHLPTSRAPCFSLPQRRRPPSTPARRKRPSTSRLITSAAPTTCTTRYVELLSPDCCTFFFVSSSKIKAAAVLGVVCVIFTTTKVRADFSEAPSAAGLVVPLVGSPLLSS